MNITIDSYGTQTISDNSLHVINEKIICFPIEGELVFFDIMIRNVIKKLKLSFSLIKCIMKYDDEKIIIVTEGAEVFIVNISTYVFKLLCHLKMVNNIYWMDMSRDRKYIALSTHVISNEITREINSQDDAMIVIDIENEIKVNYCIPSKNNFCCFYQDNNKTKLVSFQKEANGDTNAITYELIDDEVKMISSFILPIAGEVHRIKVVNDLVILSCMKRFYYLFNYHKQEIILTIHFEGNCEMGEFDFDNDMLFIPPCANKLYEINYRKLLDLGNNYIEISSKDNSISYTSTPIREIINHYYGIKSMNWSLKMINRKVAIVANDEGLMIISLQNNNDPFVYNDKHHLSMSGCGICINSTNENIAIGDLGGNITHYNPTNKTIKKVLVENEMIRALEYNEINHEVLIGVMSGKVYRYNEIKETIQLLTNCPNDETITCIRVYILQSIQYLMFSTTKGELYFYLYNSVKDDYDYLLKFHAHLPQENNTNMLFGSLKIKAEIWSFIIYPQSQLNNNENNEFYLSSASEDQTVKIWSITINQLNNGNMTSIKPIKTIKDNSLAVTCLDWKKVNLKEHKEILISCSDDRTVNGYDPLNDFLNIFTIDIAKMLYGFFTLTYIAMEDQGTSFAVGAQIGYLIIYSLETNSFTFIDKIHYGGIEGLSWKNKTIASCGNDNIFNILKIYN